MNDFSSIWSAQTITPASWLTILVSMVIAFAIGLFIAFIYRKNYRGVMYSNNFTLTLVLMTLITCPVVMCIRDSVALSMGMVGALSIVRFRTAVKDPLDTAYMFWALTMGILLGANQLFLAAVTTVVIAIMITVLVQVQVKRSASFLLVLRMTADAERTASQVIGSIRNQRLKSKTMTAGGVEATYEIRVDKPDALLNKLRSVQGVHEATLVAYTGESV